VIRATFAGFDAEEEYCRLNCLPALEGLPIIWSPDWTEARTLATRLDDIAPFISVNLIQESLHDESRLLIKQYWSAICAIAAALFAREWEPLIELKSGGIWSHQAMAKYLKAKELVPLLESFGISATCRVS
jgi:hypothetical protein